MKNLLINVTLACMAFGIYQACTPPARGADVPLTLTWTDNSDNELGFIVYFRTDTQLPFVELGRTSTDERTFVHTVTVFGGEFFEYQVSAYNEDFLGQEQESGPTDPASYRFGPAVPAPNAPSQASVTLFLD
jgi:hypothetical protein